MTGVDWERILIEHLHWADKKGLDTKRKVITQNAELKILENIAPTEDWVKETPDLENHINGKVSLSKVKKDVEHYRDGKHPEDDYYAESEAKKLVKDSEEAED